ncbi:MAG TPA: hypothetical protein VHE55_15115 [Fimbriimonadaceae bacterium]|nr:hypothetical protein [Fimbriimonadaceae bacterium]
MPVADEASSLVEALDAYISREVERNGGSTVARKPAHRVKFNWPPHPVSYSYHVLASDWTGSATFEAHGETFPVEVATTPFGVFGRCNALWLEARGADLDQMLAEMEDAAEPLFQRQLLINRCIEAPGRFTGHIRDLSPDNLLKLLYCEDRDVANDARIEIETHPHPSSFTPALIYILRDQRHPNRRSAQWCVLDLFEDLPSFCRQDDEERQAVEAMKDLIWNAEDDYARTIYKAGVVLGGHLPGESGGPALLECLNAPSKVGRRSAIHGLFHVVEWMPSTRDQVVDALQKAADRETVPELKEFARLMSRDIAHGDYDHIPEPVFPEEL